MPAIKDITFNLWAVLLGIILLGASMGGFLYGDQKEVRVKQQEVIQRVIRNEASISYIVEGIRELKEGQKEVLRSLNEAKIAAEKVKRDRQ